MKLLRRITPYLKPYWAWLPLLFLIAGMALYLVARLPPGKRFIYPLARIFGFSITGKEDLSAIWMAFLLGCFLFSLIPLIIHVMRKYPWMALSSLLLLSLFCYMPYTGFAALTLLMSNWDQLDSAQTSDHRYYLVAAPYDSGAALLLLTCDQSGIVCEIMGDDYLHNAQGGVIAAYSGSSLSLDVVGDTINVLDGDTIVSSVPIP